MSVVFLHARRRPRRAVAIDDRGACYFLDPQPVRSRPGPAWIMYYSPDGFAIEVDPAISVAQIAECAEEGFVLFGDRAQLFCSGWGWV